MKYGNIELHNVCDTIATEGEPGIRMSRLPLDIMEDVNGGVQRNTYMGAGCEIRGMLPLGGKARIVLQRDDDNCVPPIAEVFHGCMRGTIILIDKEPTEIIIEPPGNIAMMVDIHRDMNAPFDPNLVRVKFPAIHTTRIISIEGDLTYPTKDSTPDTTMLAYGSSITHGAHAVRPTGTYASQAAKHLGCDLINLGFGGSAQMDSAIADHIAARDDWDFATLEMGINVRNWPKEDFRAAVDNFVSTIASGRPDKHVFCIDLFTNNCDFMENPDAGVGFREIVKEIAEKQNSDKVVYVDGRTILTDPAGLQLDLVHPNDDGMQEMGRRLAERVRLEMRTT